MLDEAVEQLRTIVETGLTPRQREIVRAKPAKLAAAGAVHADGVHYWVRRDARVGRTT